MTPIDKANIYNTCIVYGKASVIYDIVFNANALPLMDANLTHDVTNIHVYYIGVC